MSAPAVSFKENLQHIRLNDEFVRAFEAIDNSVDHLFVTGKAGTGKSTLLQYFRLKTTKKMVVLAPTGVAAINIQGQTIHSFFRFRPDITPDIVEEIYVSKQKARFYKKLEAIVIDEISMVRADLMDCVDAFLRLYGKNPHKPFGGVQMIFFGDLYQLPPVVREEDREIFRTVYSTPYFLGAKVFKEATFRTIELQEIYRQTDTRFVDLLNAVRHNQASDNDLKLLNSRVQPAVSGGEEFTVTLTTTNAQADEINRLRLKELSSGGVQFQGAVSGEFSKKILPNQETLEFKVGAQVMFLTNDIQKRWVNGTIGKVTALVPQDDGKTIIMVKLANGQEVDVKIFTWEIYQYEFDRELQTFMANPVGYFTQYPLKRAWAVTIHKAQGLTFDRVAIDVGRGAFAHGQIYVALSRCRSLEGITLRRPISARDIVCDRQMMAFFQTVQ